MAFNRSLPAETLARIEAVIAAELPGSDARLRFSVEFVLARILSMASFEMEGYVAWVSRQILPTTCDDDVVHIHGEFWGIERRAAAIASGPVTFTGVNGAVVPAGTILRRADGLEYTLNADVTISAGTGAGSVTASNAGTASNAVATTVLSLTVPVPGIQANITVATGGITGGVDIETIASWRARIIERVQNPPHGGNEDDYKTWAKEVPGVTRVWVHPKQMGIGTVLLHFVMDNKPDTIIPSGGEVTTVRNYVLRADKAPVTPDIYVEAPVPVAVDFTIKIQPNTLEVQAAITEELKDFFQRESEPGGALMHSRIMEAISVAADEYNHELVSPDSTVIRTFGQLSVLGDITFEDMD